MVHTAENPTVEEGSVAAAVPGFEHEHPQGPRPIPLPACFSDRLSPLIENIQKFAKFPWAPKKDGNPFFFNILVQGRIENS